MNHSYRDCNKPFNHRDMNPDVIYKIKYIKKNDLPKKINLNQMIKPEGFSYSDKWS